MISLKPIIKCFSIFPSKTDVHVHNIFTDFLQYTYFDLYNRQFNRVTAARLIYKVSQYIQQHINSSCMF